jgi:hypothetical protein
MMRLLRPGCTTMVSKFPAVVAACIASGNAVHLPTRRL